MATSLTLGWRGNYDDVTLMIRFGEIELEIHQVEEHTLGQGANLRRSEERQEQVKCNDSVKTKLNEDISYVW